MLGARDDRDSARPRHRRDRGVARDRRAGLVRPRDLASSAACCFPPAPRSALALAVVARRASAACRSRRCCRSDCPTCRSTCASTRCRRSSCCCSARPPRRSRVFSAGYFRSERRHAARAASASSTTCSSPAMALVLVADDAYLFMVAWESMALVVVLPRHDRAPDSGDPPRGLPVPADRARRRDRDPALLRRAAGRQRRLHVRLDALADR